MIVPLVYSRFVCGFKYGSLWERCLPLYKHNYMYLYTHHNITNLTCLTLGHILLLLYTACVLLWDIYYFSILHVYYFRTYNTFVYYLYTTFYTTFPCQKNCWRNDCSTSDWFLLSLVLKNIPLWKDFYTFVKDFGGIIFTVPKV